MNANDLFNWLQQDRDSTLGRRALYEADGGRLDFRSLGVVGDPSEPAAVYAYSPDRNKAGTARMAISSRSHALGVALLQIVDQTERTLHPLGDDRLCLVVGPTACSLGCCAKNWIEREGVVARFGEYFFI